MRVLAIILNLAIVAICFGLAGAEKAADRAAGFVPPFALVAK